MCERAPATLFALRGSQSAAPATISGFVAPAAKLERVEDDHHVQSAAPAAKSALRSKTAAIPCACHESRLWTTWTRFPLRLPRKATTMSENAHGTTQILRACPVEMHFEDFERHECTVNRSELAAHAHATPRVDTGAIHFL